MQASYEQKRMLLKNHLCSVWHSKNYHYIFQIFLYFRTIVSENKPSLIFKRPKFEDFGKVPKFVAFFMERTLGEMLIEIRKNLCEILVVVSVKP